MTGYEYEQAVGEYLLRRGYDKVSVTKGSGDFGVDIVAENGNSRVAVQCKYYSGKVGLDAVQQVVAGKAVYDCDSAMVVTNSTFTPAAKQLAEINSVELLDRVDAKGRKFLPMILRVAGALVLGFIMVLIVKFTYDQAQIFITAEDYLSAVQTVALAVVVLAAVMLALVTAAKLRRRIADTHRSGPTRRDRKAERGFEDELEGVLPDGFRGYIKRGRSGRGYSQSRICLLSADGENALSRLKNEYPAEYEMLYDAFCVFLDGQRIHQNTLQRKLHLYHTEAGRVFDALEAVGFIGEEDGRWETLLTEDEVIEKIDECEREDM